MDLDVPGARVCVVAPASMRDETACEGLAIEEAAKRLGPDTLVVAIARYRDWSITFSATRQDRPSSGPMTLEQLEDVIAGMEHAARTQFGADAKVSGRRSARPEPLVVHDRQVIAFAQDIPMAAGVGMDKSVGYILIGKRHDVVLVVVGPSKQVALLWELAEGRLDGAEIPGEGEAAQWRSRSFWLGYWAGKMLFSLLTIAALIVVVIFVVRASRKRRS